MKFILGLKLGMTQMVNETSFHFPSKMVNEAWFHLSSLSFYEKEIVESY